MRHVLEIVAIKGGDAQGYSDLIILRGGILTATSSKTCLVISLPINGIDTSVMIPVFDSLDTFSMLKIL